MTNFGPDVPVNAPPSARLKYNRAQIHFERLKRKTDAFFQRHTYSLRRESNADMTEHVFHVDFGAAPPFEEWGLIFGDGVHNLRCALDHAVYAIGVHESGIDPPPQSQQLQFPITQDDPGWKRERWHIKSLSEPAQAAIKGLQPRGYTDDFGLTGLGGIQEFDNADKHRTLRAMAGIPIGLNSVATGYIPGSVINWEFQTAAIKERDAPIFTVRCDQPSPDVQMDKGFLFSPCVSYVRSDNEETVVFVPAAIGIMCAAVLHALSVIGPFSGDHVQPPEAAGPFAGVLWPYSSE